MDWRTMIIENPALAMALVLPVFALGAAMKIGITLMTKTGPPPDAED